MTLTDVTTNKQKATQCSRHSISQSTGSMVSTVMPGTD